MSLTLGEIRLRTRYALGLRQSDGFAVLSNPLLDHLANQAQRECRLLLRDRIKNDFGDFEGTRAERLPDDFLVETECWTDRNADNGFMGYRIVPVPYRELVAPKTRFDPDNPATGRPQRYSIIASGKSPDSFTTSTHIIKAGEFKAGATIDGVVIKAGMTVTTTTTTEGTNAALIFFDPIPTVDVRFDLFYIPLPEAMSADDDTPDFDEIYHEIVLAKVKEKAALEIGDLNRHAAFMQATLPLLAQYRILASQRRSNTCQTRISY